jgi:hypothetical protein
MSKKFVPLCWTLAVLFNIVNVYMVILFKQAFYTDHILIGGILPDPEFIGLDIVFSLVFSLPGLIGLFILVWIAGEFMYTVKAAWTLIVTGSTVVTLLCYVVLEVVIQPGMNFNDYLPFVTASLSAVWLSLIINRKRFFSSAVRRYDSHVL